MHNLPMLSHPAPTCSSGKLEASGLRQQSVYCPGTHYLVPPAGTLALRGGLLLWLVLEAKTLSEAPVLEPGSGVVLWCAPVHCSAP